MLMHYAGIVYLFLNTLEMARNFQNRGRELIYGLAGFLASRDNGTDFDSIGSYYMALRNADRSSPFFCIAMKCGTSWMVLTGLLSQKSYINRTMNLRTEGQNADCIGCR